MKWRFFANHQTVDIICFLGGGVLLSASRLLVISLTLLIAPNVLSAQEGCGDHAPHEELGRSNLRNRSPHRSPIHIGGYVTFRDNTAENIRYYWVHASAKNTSKKRIAAWSATLETAGGSGPALTLRESHDFFFTGDVLAPRASEGVSDQSCAMRFVLRPPNSNRYAQRADATALPTKASVRVQFVQFTDGSTWGDRDEAARIQLERRETLDKVKSLQQVYSERGEKAFMDVLAEPTALSCFERIKTLCRSQNHDSSCARKGIAEMLTIAAGQQKLEGPAN